MATSKVGISDCKNKEEGWILTQWSDQQWTYLIRHSDRRIRAYIAAQGIYAANNPKIGYDPGDRTSFWDQLLIFGFRSGNITNQCYADSASAVAALVRGAGTVLNNAKILSHVMPTMTIRDAVETLKLAGFSYTNEQGYLLSDGFLKAGDILWKQSHMVIVTGNGRDYLEDKGTNGLSQFLDTVKSHAGEDNAWTRAMIPGLLPNQAWDAAFISACAKANGLDNKAFVVSTNSAGLIDQSVSSGYGQFIDGPANGVDDAVPKVGDVVAFTYKEGVKVSHVGVVTNVKKDEVTVVSGDNKNDGKSEVSGKKRPKYVSVVGTYVVKPTYKSIRGYYRPTWNDYGIDGGQYDPGDWIGDSVADVYYDRSLALMREVGYCDDSGEKSLSGGKYKLSVINYTQLLELLGAGEGIGGEGGMMGEGLSEFDLAQFSELGDVGGLQEAIARCALNQVGSSYVYGGKGPSGFDCSGLCTYVYGQSGISIGSGTGGILSTGRANNTIVMDRKTYSASKLCVGDVIITRSASSESGRHATIYVGNGKVVSASGKSVGVVTRNVVQSSSDIIGVVRPLLRAR